MASGFFAILDDIGALMDDVGVATKIATGKTVGILGDDLAVNAQKATGFLASRELPVLWSITKGSFLNKLIIVPIALLLNSFFPVAITVILVLGGFYLSYEAVEKIIEYFFHPSNQVSDVIKPVENDDQEAEKAKVKSAVTTDFILSIEIVIMALGSVTQSALMIQIITVLVVSFLATIGVYGIVAIIVRMDDVGRKLIDNARGKGFAMALGKLLVNALPVIIKILGFVGTIALLLVSGGILVHNISYLHHLVTNIPSIVREFFAGLLAGLIVVSIFAVIKKLTKIF